MDAQLLDHIASKIALGVNEYLETLVAQQEDLRSRVYIDGIEPTKAHPSDAAFDLKSNESKTWILPGVTSLIRCGFAIRVPKGHVGLVCSRSGLALHQGVYVLNAPGVIDPGYEGEVCVLLHNASQLNTFLVEPGDRIAQLLIVPAPSFSLVQNANAFGTTDRGQAGFGSTGVA